MQNTDTDTQAHIREANRRIAEQYAWTKRVADWEAEHGRYDLRDGGKDYWNFAAFHEARGRYLAANPSDTEPRLGGE